MVTASPIASPPIPPNEQDLACSLDNLISELGSLWGDLIELLFPPVSTRKSMNSTRKLVKIDRRNMLETSEDSWEVYSVGSNSYDYIGGKWRRENTRSERDLLDAMGTKVEL